MGTSQDFLLHYQGIVNPVQLHELSALVILKFYFFYLQTDRIYTHLYSVYQTGN